MSAPRISAIVTAYRFERYIRTAIASIQAQTHPVDEIIVVDNRSDDATPAILSALAREDPRLVLLDVEPLGPAHARNHGLRAARGMIIAMLDGDDTWPRGKIAAQIARMEAQPHVDMVSGSTAFVDAIDDASLAPPPGARIETVLQPNIGACLYRRALLETLGGFDESYFFADDLELLLRVRDSSTPFAVLEAVMLYHRRYEGSLLTQPDRRKTQEFARAVAASYRRRRAAGLPPAATFFAAGNVPS